MRAIGAIRLSLFMMSFLICCQYARAQRCASSLTQEMIARHLPDEAIAELCGRLPRSDEINTITTGSNCKSKLNSCIAPLADRVGSACWCSTSDRSNPGEISAEESVRTPTSLYTVSIEWNGISPEPYIDGIKDTLHKLVVALRAAGFNIVGPTRVRSIGEKQDMGILVYSPDDYGAASYVGDIASHWQAAEPEPSRTIAQRVIAFDAANGRPQHQISVNIWFEEP